MPWTIAHQAPLSIGFPRQEYWSRLPFPSPGDLPNPDASPTLAGRFFTTDSPGSSALLINVIDIFTRNDMQNFGHFLN